MNREGGEWGEIEEIFSAGMESLGAWRVPESCGIGGT